MIPEKPFAVFSLRLPFLLPVAAVIAGIFIGNAGHFPPAAAAGLGALFLLGAIVRANPLPGTALLCAGIVFSMAAIQGWHGPRSVAARFAAAFPDGRALEGELRFAGQPSPRGEARWAGRGVLESAVVDGKEIRPHIPVWVEGRGELAAPGTLWTFRGSLGQPESARNPGAFDQRAWLAGDGIFSVIRIHHEADIRPSGTSSHSWLASAARWTHRAIRKTLETGLDPAATTTQLVVAMTLGEVGPVDPSVIEAFRRTGTYHLFSVSGLHVGILGALLWITLGTLGLPRTLIALIILPTLYYYALVTGWKAASIRAATMGAFVILGMLAGRPPVIMNALLGAAFAILLLQPGELFSTGFQLSFLVVGGLVVFVPAVSQWIAHRIDVDPFIPVRLHTRWEQSRAALARQAGPLVAVSLVAWFVSMPVTTAAFHEIALAAVPANILAVPLAFGIMAVAVMALVGGLAGAAVASVFNHTNSLLAAILIAVVEGASSLPFAVVPVAAPRGAEIRMTVLDFGAGGGMLVETAHAAWLIDCGPRFEADATLLPFLKSRGIRRPDGLLLTHGDARHIGGALELVARAAPRRILLPSPGARSPTYKLLESTLCGGQLMTESFSAGSRIDLGSGVVADVLFPPPGHAASMADDNAAVLLIRAAGWRIMLLSDAGPQTGHWLLAHAAGELRCDVVIKGSHRSGTADLDGLWDAASPQLVISSLTRFPPNEAVPPETRSTLAERHITLLTQDTTGAVTLLIDPEKIRIEEFLRRH